jgi:MscS family membrane protein
VVGLRSTRIRTQDRTLVTIPNGKLADMQIESFALRDRLYLGTTLRLVYATKAEQLRAILAGLEQVLREQPQLWPDGMSVRFVGLGEYSLNIEVQAWFSTTDWNQFLVIRQEALLRFIEVVEEHGSALAFPTRTLQLETPLAAPASPAPSSQASSSPAS